MRSAEKRRTAVSRTVRRSGLSTRGSAATAPSMSATNAPVTPSSTTSDIEPSGKTITGVPHSIASTTDRPNGSAKPIGCSNAAAAPSTSARRSTPIIPPCCT